MAQGIRETIENKTDDEHIFKIDFASDPETIKEEIEHACEKLVEAAGSAKVWPIAIEHTNSHDGCKCDGYHTVGFSTKRNRKGPSVSAEVARFRILKTFGYKPKRKINA